MKDQKKSARKQTFTVKVNYSDKDYTTVYEDISVTNREMQIRKAAPGTDRESWTGIMRGHAMLAIPACKSKEVTLKFQRTQSDIFSDLESPQQETGTGQYTYRVLQKQ